MIQRRVERWAVQTGFRPVDLTRYILCANAPRLSGVSATVWRRGRDWPGDPLLERDEVTITLDKRDITQAQFLELFKSLSGWLQLERVRAMTANDRQILDAAKKVDRAEFKSERQYVAAVYRKLPRKLREEWTPAVLGQRHRRLKKRLETRAPRT